MLRRWQVLMILLLFRTKVSPELSLHQRSNSSVNLNIPGYRDLVTNVRKKVSCCHTEKFRDRDQPRVCLYRERERFFFFSSGQFRKKITTGHSSSATWRTESKSIRTSARRRRRMGWDGMPKNPSWAIISGTSSTRSGTGHSL